MRNPPRNHHPAFHESPLHPRHDLHRARHPDRAGFLHGATLAPAEQERLALPARTALERFIRDIPAPNFMPHSRQKELLKWGRKTIPEIIGKFTASDLDFTRVMPAFEHALRPDDTRR